MLYTYTLCVDVALYLNGMLLPDNSMVFLGDIGEGSNALYCLSNREACCNGLPRTTGRRGVWRFPDGSDVTESNTADFYFTRGSSFLSLNRRSSTTGPTGTFRCLIPNAQDSDSTFQTLTVQVIGGKFSFRAGFTMVH